MGMVVHHLINGVIMGLSRRDSTLIELSSDPAAFYVFAGLWLVLAAFTMAISVKALMFYFKNRR
ncbi:hypothetical protein J2858_001376 [Neorhizobium galegae]|uniref:hypothetical protein n=1 Tax=Rhizobium/Agrobacterium group TaxID=227290 RepID=UPI001AE14266|nr:hypothetical protein [Neorhizobium galegae]MBP2548483.1 hypothetical protein [Neorhizobium galegae]